MVVGLRLLGRYWVHCIKRHISFLQPSSPGHPGHLLLFKKTKTNRPSPRGILWPNLRCVVCWNSVVATFRGSNIFDCKFSFQAGWDVFRMTLSVVHLNVLSLTFCDQSVVKSCQIGECRSTVLKRRKKICWSWLICAKKFNRIKADMQLSISNRQEKLAHVSACFRDNRLKGSS